MSEKPTNVAAVMSTDRMFAHDTEGKPVVRQSRCECGRAFTQRLLSERFLNIVERRGERCLQLMARDVPGGWVPVHCPPCESADLGRAARRASYLPTNYLDREEAAD